LRFADDGVVRNVVIPVARPETPVEMGKPVQFVKVPEDGVPMFGVVKDGEVANTRRPVPVLSVIAELRLADDGVVRNVVMPAARQVRRVEIGKPVQLVKVPADGVPMLGVVKEGEVEYAGIAN